MAYLYYENKIKNVEADNASLTNPTYVRSVPLDLDGASEVM